jgi:Double zinc ribbon
MACPRCRTDAPPQARFCLECGARLSTACVKCNAELPASAKFCLACGEPVGARPGDARSAAPDVYTPRYLAEKILTTRPSLEGERKLVTVLFVDIVESSRLAERLDPEDMHELMDRALRLMAQAVHRYEGTVNQLMGTASWRSSAPPWPSRGMRSAPCRQRSRSARPSEDTASSWPGTVASRSRFARA